MIGKILVTMIVCIVLPATSQACVFSKVMEHHKKKVTSRYMNRHTTTHTTIQVQQPTIVVPQQMPPRIIVPAPAPVVPKKVSILTYSLTPSVTYYTAPVTKTRTATRSVIRTSSIGGCAGGICPLK